MLESFLIMIGNVILTISIPEGKVKSLLFKYKSAFDLFVISKVSQGLEPTIKFSSVLSKLVYIII